MTSSGSGAWIKQFTLPDFRRYSLEAIEKSVPYDYSRPPKTFVLATETPIIDKVTGNGAPIENGGTYDGDSLEFSGYAPPVMEVEALNGDTSTGKKATVDRDGLFKLTFDGLVAGNYSIKIRAANDKESSAFTFRVVRDVELSLDEVADSRGTIPEGGTTDDGKVKVSGHANPGEGVQLRNNDTPVDGATATAREDGYWEIEIDVTPATYSLTVEALYGDGEISAPPRTFTVASIIKPRNTRVYDSDGLIENNGSTPYNHVIVRGDAAPSTQIRLKINGIIDPRPELVDDEGKWARLVTRLEYETTYQFIAVADYGDNSESNPWTITPGVLR